MTEIVSIYTTFPEDEEARRIGRALVEERLAACVNILGPCHSIYRWKGEIEEAGEVAAIFKTGADKAEALIARLTALHSYDVPAAVVWPAGKAPNDYAAWVIDSIG